MKFNRIFRAIVVSAMVLTAMPTFAQSKSTFAYFGAGNTDFGSGVYGINTQSSTQGAAVGVNGSQAFTGLDNDGDMRTMTAGGTASASAQYGTLRTNVSGFVNNNYYNPDNPYFWEGPGNNPNFEGSPDHILIGAQASYNDVFTYGGTANATVRVNFYFHVHGVMSGTNAYAGLQVTNDGVMVANYVANPGANGIVDEVFATDFIEIGGDLQINHNVLLYNGFDVKTYNYIDGATIAGQADFGNTITMVGMSAIDADGNPLSGWTVNSGSGTNYPVPEPATMTILGIAAVVAAIKRKKA